MVSSFQKNLLSYIFKASYFPFWEGKGIITGLELQLKQILLHVGDLQAWGKGPW